MSEDGESDVLFLAPCRRATEKVHITELLSSADIGIGIILLKKLNVQLESCNLNHFYQLASVKMINPHPAVGGPKGPLWFFANSS